MSEFIHQFHFLRPEWLWALLLLPVLIWQVNRLTRQSSGWQQLVAPELLAQLLQGEAGKQLPMTPLVSACWLLGILALAGPSWQKQPQPLFQLQQARVLAMDMSLSLYSTDLKPNRLSRMRYKAMDLLDRRQDGEVGLVAFSAEPFTISPLTNDHANLKNLIPSLTPELMPTRGSRPDKAVEAAIGLLQSAGYPEGEVILLTDAITEQQAKTIAEQAENSAVSVSVLAVGTHQAAPVKLADGSLLKDSKGAIVLPRLDPGPMKDVSRRTGGRFSLITADDSDLAYLGDRLIQASLQDGKARDRQSDLWHDAGYWLVLLLLPGCLVLFRKGVVLALLAVLWFPAPPVEAIEWQALWKNPDQRGYQAYKNQAYAEAAELFRDHRWRGANLYKSGDYQGAHDAFAEGDSASDWHNRGNALAQQQKFQEAINAYTEALKRDPDQLPSQKNKELLEKMLKQQQQSANQDPSQQQNSEQQTSERQTGQGSEGSSDSDSSSTQEHAQDKTSDFDANNQHSDSAGRDSRTTSSPLGAPESNQNTAEQANAEAASMAEPKQEEQSDPADANTTLSAQAGSDGLPQQQQQELQRWLEQVPDDPSLLLRNKMRLEYEQRRKAGKLDREEQQW
jgi:Ca-activated chloride channel family protein